MAPRQGLDDIIRDAIMRSKNSERKFAELPAKVRIKRRMAHRGLLSNPYDYEGKQKTRDIDTDPLSSIQRPRFGRTFESRPKKSGGSRRTLRDRTSNTKKPRYK